MSPTVILIIVALVGPFASWGLTSLKAAWDQSDAVAAAVETTEARERATCSAQVTAIQTSLNNKLVEAQRLASQADREHNETPIEAAALRDLCNASASCRSRTKKEPTK